MGVIFEHGDGVPEDYLEALRWYKLAADQGFASAQFKMGFMYNSGKGVKCNYPEAMRWLKLAAEQGDATALCHIGFMFEQIGRAHV